jgi:hypothetical protein
VRASLPTPTVPEPCCQTSSTANVWLTKSSTRSQDRGESVERRYSNRRVATRTSSIPVRRDCFFGKTNPIRPAAAQLGCCHCLVHTITSLDPSVVVGHAAFSFLFHYCVSFPPPSGTPRLLRPCRPDARNMGRARRGPPSRRCRHLCLLETARLGATRLVLLGGRHDAAEDLVLD